jgi:hypothetical protein
MKRIVIHWTAGAHTPSSLDLQHYHFVIDGAGWMHTGKFPIAANLRPVKGAYAAHTLNLNTGSIGIAVAAMAGAVERPFNAGRFPITPAQVDALVKHCALLADEYGIPVTRETILTHAEVQPTLGVKQRGKWDITWLPGMDKPGNPVTVGDELRGMILKAQMPEVIKTMPPKGEPRPAPEFGVSWFAKLIAAFMGLIGKGKK